MSEKKKYDRKREQFPYGKLPAPFAVCRCVPGADSGVRRHHRAEYQFRKRKYFDSGNFPDSAAADRRGESVQYYLENPPSAYSDGGNPGRCSVPVGLPFTDFL